MYPVGEIDPGSTADISTLNVTLSDVSIANLNKMQFFISEDPAQSETTWIQNMFLSLILFIKVSTFSKVFLVCLTSPDPPTELLGD